MEIEKPKKVIGKGGSARILAGRFQGRDVAVKVLLHTPDDDVCAQFEGEVATLMNCKHTNIVHCFGAIMRKGKPPGIVLELMEGGALSEAYNSLEPMVRLSQNVAHASNLLCFGISPFSQTCRGS